MVAAVNNIAGIEAYQKVLKASRGFKPQESMAAAEQSMNILRSGDNLEVVSIGKQISPAPLFPEVLQEVVREQKRKMVKADSLIQKDIMADAQGNVSGVDLVELNSALNESEMALQLTIAARDKVVNMYQELMKMPL